MEFKKGGIEFDFPGWLVFSIAVGIIAILGILILKGKLTGGISYIRNLFRFG